MVRRLGNLVSEFIDVAHNDQDYYVARSAIVGEAIMWAVDGPTLGRVLWQFHDHISPLRVANYETFQQYAYDDKIMGKAFSKWEEGRKFYEMVYGRNESYPRSYYILQQSALHCAKKGHFLEAFELIDKAVTLSGGEKWSIRNSQAFILFDANISLQQDDEVRSALRRSMEILSRCYRWDRRKAFHATTFADQALQLRNVFEDEEVRTYLLQADTWLQEEAMRSPWSWHVKDLMPKVRDALRVLGVESNVAARI